MYICIIYEGIKTFLSDSQRLGVKDIYIHNSPPHPSTETQKVYVACSGT